MSAMSKPTEDHAHVLLDAIVIARMQADATNLQPWNDYDASPYDDKSDRSGWFGLLDEAAEWLGELLNAGGSVEVSS